MSLEPQEQLKKFLGESKEVLLLIPENPSGDAVGSAWALYFFLEKRGSTPTIAFSNNLDPKYSYLPRPERILTEITGARDFILQFDTTFNKIANVHTEEKDTKLNIHITPEKGTIDPRDFSFVLAKFKYDLIIVLDSSDLLKLGKIYEKNPDLFFEVPVVNIDHRSNNENFGQINLVDVIASSCSEILSNVLENIDPAAIDKNIADCLLTGIISATDSFQKKNTTPKALLSAAALMDKGANQQEIIRWLYKTQPLHILKLWGRAMAKLKWDEKSQLVWSELSLEDFIQSRASINDVSAILEKLQENYSDGKIFILIYNDTPTSAVAKIKTTSLDLLQLVHKHLDGAIDKKDFLEINLPSNNLTEIGEMLSKRIKEMGV
ncbi:MAG: DHH family phosphoesterase [Parcubacteria group bacterium]|jgi:nanoRNase/pAp phosphatase (c-di-AMP/oligoRNAs hydrolase)